ncbi:hypothetical protein JXD20_04685 [Candidatus Peregrinibacteria bacterium]|nr:hypothetical protein [Candidatus Peregrinibacteria bacterium]
MKKLLTLLLTFTLVILPGHSLLATADMPFFEALGNRGYLKDYKLIQSFYGNLEFEEGEDHFSADFRVSINSTVDAGLEEDSFSRISAFIKFVNHNEVSDSTPFKEMTVQANGEVIMRDQKDMYFKLNNFNIGLMKPLPFAVVDVENALATVNLYRGTWYHTTVNELAVDEYGEEMIDTEAYMAFEEELKKNPKEAILGLSELILYDSDEDFTEEEINPFLDGLEMLLDSNLFTVRDIIAGQNTGFKFFNLNKGAILNLVEEVAHVFGEEMRAEDKLMLRTELGKISLSGIYRVDPLYDTLDNFLIRFKLREAGPLNNFELNYRFKLRDINIENSVKAPIEYKEMEDIFGTYENNFDEDEWFYDEDYPAPEF